MVWRQAALPTCFHTQRTLRHLRTASAATGAQSPTSRASSCSALQPSVPRMVALTALTACRHAQEFSSTLQCGITSCQQLCGSMCTSVYPPELPNPPTRRPHCSQGVRLHMPSGWRVGPLLLVRGIMGARCLLWGWTRWQAAGQLPDVTRPGPPAPRAPHHTGLGWPAAFVPVADQHVEVGGTVRVDRMADSWAAARRLSS